VFAEVTYHAAYEPMRCVRTKRHKYIHRFDGRTTPVMPNCDEGETRDFWLAHGWNKRPVDQEQLYDLIFDPMEQRNLADDAQSEPVLRDMRKRLQDFMVRTADPLLNGPVPAPPGAQINDPDDMSPHDPVSVV
jgi:N-sulfoglucosamine sulfohydrolase